jgi:hypothetical protein
MSAPKYELVVHEPKDVLGKVGKARSIKLALTGNTYYGTPSPTIIIFDGHITDVINFEAATKTTPPTKTVTDRNGAVDIMDGDIESYRLAGQALVNAAPNHTVANQIAESFDMELKTHTSKGPRQDELLDGPVPNSVLYRMKGTGPHQIQTSADHGVTTLPVDPSGKGEKVITGLTLLVNMWYRNRQILPGDTFSDWTDWKPFAPTK